MKTEIRIENGEKIVYTYDETKYNLESLIASCDKYRADQDIKQKEFDAIQEAYLKKQVDEKTYLDEKIIFQQWQETDPHPLFTKEAFVEEKHTVNIDLITDDQIISLANRLLPFINQQTLIKI